MIQSKIHNVLIGVLLCVGMGLVWAGCAAPGTTTTVDGSVGVNISDQPVWGPTGYDRADYYYIPDIDSYYSVSDHQYIYRDGANWKHEANLPPSYGNYDPYHSYKVVVNGTTPYQANTVHREQYGKYKGVKDQPVIRDSHDSKYFVNKNHPNHEAWARDHQH